MGRSPCCDESGWSSIAGHLSGRTDNEIKNYWNTHIRKKLIQMGIDPVTHRPRTDHLNVLAALPQLLAAANFNNLLSLNQNIQLDATSIAKAQLLQSMIQVLNTNNNTSSSSFDIHHTNNNIFGQSSFQPNISENLYDPIPSLSHIDHQPLDSFSSPIRVASHQDGQDMIPPLISVSPDESKQTQMMIKNKGILNHNDHTSNPSSTSTFTQDHHQPWCDIIDDEASDSYWKEIIEQTCSEPWPFRD
ncbi:unnamed protein product [Thlaspi arvense]|uniref:Uncharacterized protein n=1 Tax=Thlaspi arvense TaxID=13288 RepID=A0AAU9S1W6_THLAR|nr:unnamed protein product [Thlaspi arvense]